VPASPSETAPSGSDACLRTPCAKSAYGRPNRSAMRRVHDHAAARHACHQLHRPVVVRRPEPAGDHAEVEAEALPQRCLELVRPVADDDDPRKVEAEGEQLAGQKRTVRVREHAVDELASCDDDRGARPVQAVAVEALMPLGPTMKYPVFVPGAGTVFPFNFQVRLPG